MKTYAIIQARTGSLRLPNKVLLEVMGKTILEYIIERVKEAKNIEDIVVATTINKRDLPIVNLASSLGVSVYCGSEEDVLDRFYQAAKLFKMRNIVRITADCPLIDPDIVDSIIKLYFKSRADYCSNTLKETFPDGLDVEVFSFNVLMCAWKEASLMSEREHVTSYITKHPNKFKLLNFANKTNLSSKRWTLDRKEDFRLIKSILESLYPNNPHFKMFDVLQFLRKNPHLEKLNAHIMKNEGYYKSMQEDELKKSRG